MKIEVGKYYLNEDGELVYVFASGGVDIAGSLQYSDEVKEEEVIGMVAIKVLPFITRDEFLQFDQSMSTITVFIKDGTPTCPEMRYKDSGLVWQDIEPSQGIKERFEKTFKSMSLVKLFVNHMYDTYSEKYKEETIRVKDVLT